MTKEFSPDRLDVKAFVQAGARLSGHDSLLKYERLAQEARGLHPDLRVDWEAVGESRPEPGADGGFHGGATREGRDDHRVGRPCQRDVGQGHADRPAS